MILIMGCQYSQLKNSSGCFVQNLVLLNYLACFLMLLSDSDHTEHQTEPILDYLMEIVSLPIVTTAMEYFIQTVQ